MQKFNLAVIQPVKGKKGNLKFTITKVANSIDDAVRQVREMVADDWIVLQEAALK